MPASPSGLSLFSNADTPNFAYTQHRGAEGTENAEKSEKKLLDERSALHAFGAHNFSNE